MENPIPFNVSVDTALNMMTFKDSYEFNYARRVSFMEVVIVLGLLTLIGLLGASAYYKINADKPVAETPVLVEKP